MLHRSGVGHEALPLKKASVASGLITEAEYAWFYAHLGNVRKFTLIPLHALAAALSADTQKVPLEWALVWVRKIHGFT